MDSKFNIIYYVASDLRKLIAFLCLPYIFPVFNIKRKLNQKLKRPSKLEVQVAFIAHFNVSFTQYALIIFE